MLKAERRLQDENVRTVLDAYLRVRDVHIDWTLMMLRAKSGQDIEEVKRWERRTKLSKSVLARLEHELVAALTRPHDQAQDDGDGDRNELPAEELLNPILRELDERLHALQTLKEAIAGGR